MKILIVKYLPSSEKSNTLKLLNHLKEQLCDHKYTEVDLLKNTPKFHDEVSMEAYKSRNFGGQTLNSVQSASLKEMDDMAEQFAASDLIVLVTPMHNFSLPGIVKTYFDAVMQSGLTFKYEGDEQIGLMNGSKFLTIYTSMGSYKGGYGFMDNLRTITKIELDFMGFKDYEFVHASTGNKTTYDFHIEKAKNKISEISQKWLN